jgi:hypothetical protein
MAMQLLHLGKGKERNQTLFFFFLRYYLGLHGRPQLLGDKSVLVGCREGRSGRGLVCLGNLVDDAQNMLVDLRQTTVGAGPAVRASAREANKKKKK